MPHLQDSDSMLVKFDTVENPVSPNDCVPCVFIKSGCIGGKSKRHGSQKIDSFFDLLDNLVGSSRIVGGDVVFDRAKLS